MKKIGFEELEKVFNAMRGELMALGDMIEFSASEKAIEKYGIVCDLMGGLETEILIAKEEIARSDKRR